MRGVGETGTKNERDCVWMSRVRYMVGRGRARLTASVLPPPCAWGVPASRPLASLGSSESVQACLPEAGLSQVTRGDLSLSVPVLGSWLEEPGAHPDAGEQTWAGVQALPPPLSRL